MQSSGLQMCGPLSLYGSCKSLYNCGFWSHETRSRLVQGAGHRTWVGEQRTPSNSDCACARSVCHRLDVSRPHSTEPSQPSANNTPPDVAISTEPMGAPD